MRRSRGSSPPSWASPRRSRALWAAIRRVWASARSAHALAYQRRAGAEAADPGLAVILQAMVDPVVSGVAFSCDPVTGDPATAVISAVTGREGLVSGAWTQTPTGSVQRATTE